MPTFAQAAAASSDVSAPKSFWPRGLFTASPHPSQLPGGWQLEQAPMCPCYTCWETGSPRHIPQPKKDKTEPKNKAAAPTALSASSLPSLLKKSRLHFLRKRPSLESVASDMRPLHKAATATSRVDSVSSVCEKAH